MDRRFVVTDIVGALERREFPSVTLWNRLEARPRTTDFARALKAQVRDALWMLSRQWQMGEFRGEDAGSPIGVKVQMTTSALQTYQPADQAPEAFDDATPLEAKVERRSVPFIIEGHKVSLDLRVQMGRQWLKLVAKVGNYAQAYIQAYPIAMPDPESAGDVAVCSHVEAWQVAAAMAGRCMDGADLYFYLKADALHHAYDGIPVLPLHKQAIDAAAQTFIAWFERLYLQPMPATDAWVPDQLEYQFTCTAPWGTGEKTYNAQEYYQGRLDWYVVDTAATPARGVSPLAAQQPDPRAVDTRSSLPAPIKFAGMPDTRWWAFEDGKTNFGDIRPDTTEIGKLLLMEFALVYANDWFILPYTLPAGSIAQVTGMAVTNVFGERLWVEAAGSKVGDTWQRWGMYEISNSADGADDPALLLLPTAPKVQEGDPTEEVLFIRDEIADMVWGIEKTVSLATGEPKRGDEAAAETRGYLLRLLTESLGGTSPPVVAPVADLRYQVMNTVPENWIPFISIHVPGDNRETQLQRAALPRLFPGDPNPPKKVQPQTPLLRTGLDRTPALPYFVHEDEVPRSGIRLTQSFQRTRWYDGQVFVWLGARKEVGRGEGASGLCFDQAVDTRRSSQT